MQENTSKPEQLFDKTVRLLTTLDFDVPYVRRFAKRDWVNEIRFTLYPDIFIVMERP